MRIFQYIPEFIKEPIRNLKGIAHPYGLPLSEFKRLRAFPRYQDTLVRFLERDFQICDAASFLHSHKEIFVENIYSFETVSRNPVIFDVGANVGLATVYFGQKFPGAKIIAIESDNRIVDILRNNIDTYLLSNVEIHHGAAWKSNEDLHFSSDRADGGRLSNNGSEIVPGIRLLDLLKSHDLVDLLKMDIEGAETAVLEDCEPLLGRVERLFVEYHSIVGQRQTLGAIISILEKAGFRYYIDRACVQSPHPLIRRNVINEYDLQLNIFATRH
ncbi:FkbM family methyltransferase [Pseudomonadota bacterium]